jgi:peptidoglycan hydrolase-like protein with peptidoglycan-binding domain
MAIITNLIDRTSTPVLLLTLMLLTFTVTASASDTSTTASAERIVAVETRLAELGYWITKVDGRSDDSTRQAIIAFQKVNGLKRTGVLDDNFMSLLPSAVRPEAKHSGAAHVEIDITRQVIFLVNDEGQVTRVLSTSTGSGERYQSEGKWERAYTPRGTFKIYRQIKGNRKAALGTLYYPSYFNGGWAIHGSNSVPAKAASHGCARIPRFAEKEMSSLLRVGMTVYVYD